MAYFQLGHQHITYSYSALFISSEMEQERHQYISLNAESELQETNMSG